MISFSFPLFLSGNPAVFDVQLRADDGISAGIVINGGRGGSLRAVQRDGGLQLCPGKEISVFDYSQVVFSALLGWIVFGQIPDTLSFVGYAVIIAVAVMLYRHNRKVSS
ncbi:MAG: hypothetical protein ACLSA6_13240 [Holdemania massiliensis]